MITSVNIDGDIIRYSVGFAAEGDPIENCLHSVKLMIQNILSKTGATEYTVYLTGKNNYRDSIAVTKPYKGNRDSSHKPTYFNEITEYLIAVHGAVVINGMEADDAMGIAQTEDTCIASIDKDMNMIAGWHYNWKRDELYYVDEEEADLFFYKQLLMGDSTDNIVGIPGLGPKTAEKIIAEADNMEDLYWTILEKYAEHYERPFEVMMEMAHLLWIQREEGVLWQPIN